MVLARKSLQSLLAYLHQPIGNGDVDLAMVFVARVDKFDVREVARQKVRRRSNQDLQIPLWGRLSVTISGGCSPAVHYLRQKLKCASNQCLRGYNGRKNRDNQRWVEHVRRDGLEKRVRICGRIPRDVGRLANVRHQERWECKTQPSKLHCSL